MSDRMLARFWWFATMSMILICGMGALLCAYHGVFAAFAHRTGQAVFLLALVIPLTIAAYTLCKHRGDLVCD